MCKSIKNLLCFLLIISLVGNLFQFCYGIRRSNKTYTEALSYQEFTSFFDNFNNNFKIEGYQNLYNNDTPQIVYIGPAASFGKRSYLTVDGNASDLQTQKRIEFIDISTDNGKLITIDFIYLDTPLYADMLYWNDPLWNDENKHLKDIYTDNILSYRNVLIKTSVFSFEDGEENISKDLIEITACVTSFISGTQEDGSLTQRDGSSS